MKGTSWSLSVGCLFLSTWSVPAWALDAQECSDLHLVTQMTRAEGQLTQAAKTADECGNAACPEPIRSVGAS